MLLLGVASFSLVVGDRFFHPFNLSLILQQVTIIGMVGIAPDADRSLPPASTCRSGRSWSCRSVVMGRLAVDFGVPV